MFKFSKTTILASMAMSVLPVDIYAQTITSGTHLESGDCLSPLSLGRRLSLSTAQVFDRNALDNTQFGYVVENQSSLSGIQSAGGAVANGGMLTPNFNPNSIAIANPSGTSWQVESLNDVDIAAVASQQGQGVTLQDLIVPSITADANARLVLDAREYELAGGELLYAQPNTSADCN